ETINDQLKNISQIEHSRHRSVSGFMLNMIAGLIAYQLRDNKPQLNITHAEFDAIAVIAC
ncbi:MAG: transposase, partial [Enterovibrio sp.]